MEKKLRLLIADDDSDVIEILKDSFELFNSKGEYEIITAQTGQAALKYINEGIFALSTDGSMDRKGPNGIGLIKAARGCNIPAKNIILYTGQPDKYWAEARDLDIRVIQKPANLEDLRKYFNSLR